MNLLLILSGLCLAVAHPGHDGSASGRTIESKEDDKGPLFLTPYIERHQIEEARKKSRVPLFKDFKVDAHSGYITTDAENTKHLFFLYTKAEDKLSKKVLLWLYGGPGTSALTAQFVYNGPVGVKLLPDGNATFFKRSDTFQKNYHVIYLDAPAGSGFSFENSTNNRGFDKTSKEVAESIQSFLNQFFKLFPGLKNKKLFVNGESYAARYAVALAAKRERLPQLTGVMLGIPFLGNVVDALNPTSFLSCVGMLDQNGVNQFNERFHHIKDLFRQERYGAALEVISLTILNSENQKAQTLYTDLTGFRWHGSALRSDMPLEIALYYALTNTSQIRQQLHVGNIPREAQRFQVVYSLASGDFNVDMGETFAGVLNSSFPVLMYAAKMDTVAPSPTFHAHFNNITWSGADAFKKAARRGFFTNATYFSRQTLRYYKKELHNVTMVDVAFAGHYVSIDKPKVVLEIVNKFVKKYE